MSPREQLLAAFVAALDAVDGQRVVAPALTGLEGEVALVSLGKAAASMARGALAVPGLFVAHGFVCLPPGYGHFDPPSEGDWQVHLGGHPIPDLGSLAAGAALVRFLEALPPAMPLVVLMSGGSSACVEHLRDGITLKEVIARTDRLLASGADIRALNAARSEWSLLKNGRAFNLAGPREVQLCVLSDVPRDDPALVGSGPFYEVSPRLHVRLIGSNGMAVVAVMGAARAIGQTVHSTGVLQGEAVRQAQAIVRYLQSAAPGMYVWGGECTVVLPEAPGQGGRCQQLALAAAIALEGREDIVLLAAGTDGVDGASPDAGAIVDGGTAGRIRADGQDPVEALARCNAGPALAAGGELIHTGPTGTNVMDLVLALKA